MQHINIRPIQPEDNQVIEQVVRDVFIELDIPKIGTAYADPQLKLMFEAYDKPRAIYFVVEKDGKIIGGAGVGQLENEDESICELQKMYFLPEARGLGLGIELMEKCLAKAKEFGFESCYLETMPYMESAQKLYKKVGFEYLDQPLGCTGHTSCSVWMLKKL